MAKSLYGGGAVLTGALLLASLAFNARPSVAESLASFDSTEQTQQKPNSTGTSLPTETSPNANNAPANETAAKPETAAAALKPDAGRATPTVEKNPTGATLSLSAEKYTATAYSLLGRTASGATVRRGLIAADRRVLPLGSRVRIDAGSYSGEYLVADRGSAIRGRIIDIWVPSTREAMRFGRRSVRLTVLSYGSRHVARATKARR
ncbi:MAG: 3D domain-containing protein [Acidobacteria bacterium]|nr:3D domain-containing protein [Acidobacteriota bacterium]MCA1641635.1 3D domain-containing protein [Acidobacteriota bacterium]